MEDFQRKEVRLLSALSDLKLEARKNPTKEGDFEERRKIRKIGAVKDDDEELIYTEPFTKMYRKKKPHDKKVISDSLMSHFTFSYLEESIREVLLDKFNFCKVEEGQYLIKQGDNASCFFILHEGKMTVEIDGEIKKRLAPSDGGFG
jgi:cGMP-dependent protein kinase